MGTEECEVLRNSRRETGQAANLQNNMIQIAAKRGQRLQILRAGAEGGDLQWFIPVRVEYDDAQNQCAVLLSRALNCYGVPHFFRVSPSDALGNADPHRIRLGLEPAGISCLATHAETSRTRFQTDLGVVHFHLLRQALSGSACESRTLTIGTGGR